MLSIIKNLGRVFLTFVGISLIFASSLSAACTVIGNGVVCDDTVDNTVFANSTLNISGRDYLNVTAEGAAYGIYNDSNGTWNITRVNVNFNGSAASAVYLGNASLNAGADSRINNTEVSFLTQSDGYETAIYAMSAVEAYSSNISLGNNSRIDGTVYLYNGGNFSLGDNAVLSSLRIEEGANTTNGEWYKDIAPQQAINGGRSNFYDNNYYDYNIALGDNSRADGSIELSYVRDGSISIGDNSSIDYTWINDYESNSGYYEYYHSEDTQSKAIDVTNFETFTLKAGDNSTINGSVYLASGANSTLGVTIGDNANINSGSVQINNQTYPTNSFKSSEIKYYDAIEAYADNVIVQIGDNAKIGGHIELGGDLAVNLTIGDNANINNTYILKTVDRSDSGIGNYAEDHSAKLKTEAAVSVMGSGNTALSIGDNARIEGYIEFNGDNSAFAIGNNLSVNSYAYEEYKYIEKKDTSYEFADYFETSIAQVSREAIGIYGDNISAVIGDNALINGNMALIISNSNFVIGDNANISAVGIEDEEEIAHEIDTRYGDYKEFTENANNKDTYTGPAGGPAIELNGYNTNISIGDNAKINSSIGIVGNNNSLVIGDNAVVYTGYTTESEGSFVSNMTSSGDKEYLAEFRKEYEIEHQEAAISVNGDNGAVNIGDNARIEGYIEFNGDNGTFTIGDNAVINTVFVSEYEERVISNTTENYLGDIIEEESDEYGYEKVITSAQDAIALRGEDIAASIGNNAQINGSIFADGKNINLVLGDNAGINVVNYQEMIYEITEKSRDKDFPEFNYDNYDYTHTIDEDFTYQAIYASGNGVSVTNSGASILNINGSITSINNANVNLTFGGGTLRGATDSDIYGVNGYLGMSFGGSSGLWVLESPESSSVSDLRLESGARVDLTRGGASFGDIIMTNLYIGNLYGNGGIFDIRFDTENRLNDQINITQSSEGTHHINFYDKTLGGNEQGNISLLVVAQNSGAAFNATFTGSIDVAGYTYNLTRDENNNWWLGIINFDGNASSVKCQVVGNGVVCQETVDSAIYAYPTLNIETRDYLNVTVNDEVGLYNNANGTWNIKRVNINTNGTDAISVLAENGGVINLGNNSVVSTIGSSNYGIYAANGSKITAANDINISTDGTGAYYGSAYAVFAANSDIEIGDNAIVSTDGTLSFAVMAGGTSNVNIGDNANLSTSGDRSSVVYNNGLDSRINIGDNASISAFGIGGTSDWDLYGIYAGYGDITLGDNANIYMNGSYIKGIYADRGNVTLGDNANINVLGYGLQSARGNINIGNNSVITSSGIGVNIYTGSPSIYGGTINIGDNAIIDSKGSALSANNYGTINVGDNANISSLGSGGAHGVSAASGIITIGDNVNIFKSGGAHAVYASGGSVVIGDNANITADYSGLYTSGTYANINIGDNASIFTNSTSIYDAAIYANSGTITLGDNADIGSNNLAIYAYGANSLVTNSGGEVNIYGNINSANNANVTLRLDDNSLFNGSASTASNGVINLSIDGTNSLWTLRGNSTVTNLNLANNATVDLTRGNALFSSTGITNLIINNLYGNGIFNVRYDLDNLWNDLIVINSSSSGNHHVNFFDQTTGGYTLSDNISLLVVQQSNTSGNYNAIYTGKIDLGGYEYNLTKGESNDNWYIGLNIEANTSANTTTCEVVGNGVVCYETVNGDIYANNDLNITNRDYLNVTVNNNGSAVRNQNNGTWNIATVNVNTNGTNAYGIEALNSGVNIGDNANIFTNGTNAYGVYASNTANIVIGDNADITTNGATSYAVLAASNSNISIGNNTHIATLGGNYAYGLYTINNGHINVGDNFSFVGTGYDSAGVWINNAAGSLIIGDNASFYTAGDLSEGIASAGTTTIGDNLNVFTSGNNAVGIWAESTGITTIGDNSNIHTVGTGSSYGVYAYSGTVNIGDNAAIVADNSYGIYNHNGVISLGNNTNITANSSGAYAIYQNNTGIIQNQNGSVLYVNGNIASVHNGSNTNLYFGDGSLFMGATLGTGIGLAFDGSNSLWQLTDNSTVTDLTLTNGARVDLTRGNSSYLGTGWTTLNISNLYGNGGIFDVRYDATTLVSDIIAISQSSSGTHNIHFYDQTSGAYNINNLTAILVVQQGGGSNFNANFLGTFDIGGYEYNLTKANGNNWYLGNASIVTPPPPSVCEVVGNGVVCYESVTNEIYANSTFDIQNRDYLNVTADGNGIDNSNNGSWNIARVDISSNGSGVYAEGSSVDIGENSSVNSQDSGLHAQNANITAGDNLLLVSGTNGIETDLSNINIGDGLIISSESYGIYAGQSNITIGRNAEIISNTYYGIYSGIGSNIALGDGARISADTFAVTTIFGSAIEIGDNATLNGGVGTIGGTVTIGDNSKITAGDYSYGTILGVEIDNIAVGSQGIFGGGAIDIGKNATIDGNIFALNANINIDNGADIDGIVGTSSGDITLGDGVAINSANISIAAIDNGRVTLLGDTVVTTTGDGALALAAANNSNIVLSGDTQINAAGNNALAIYAYENSVISTSAAKTLNITGDILAENNGLVDLNISDGGAFLGSTALVSNGDVINLSFDGANSLWRLTDNSKLSNLRLTNNAVVDFGAISSLSAAALNVNNLYGNGVFNIRYDLQNAWNDKIVVDESSSGVHQVNFLDKTAGGYTLAENRTLTVVYQENASGNYNAVYSGKIDLGGLEYNLTKESSSDNWYVGIYFDNTSTPNNGTNGTTTPTPTCTNAHCAIKSFLNINYLVNFVGTETLLQRMGELRNGQNRNGKDDVWVRTYLGKMDSFDDATRLEGVNYYGIQLGADREYDNEYATSHLGWAVGYASSDIDYLKGSGESNSYFGGLYATLLFPSNFYLDFLGKYIYNKNEFDTVTSNGYAVTGDGDIQGFSFAVEGGKRFDISGFYVEPQISVTYYRQEGGDISSSDHMKIRLNSFDSYLARAGLLVGYKLKNTANIYLKTGYIKEMAGEASYNLNGNEIEYELNSNIFDNSVGFTLREDNHNIYLEGIYQIGDKFNNIKANFGYRYDF